MVLFTFISLNKEFINQMKKEHENSYCMKIQDYIPKKEKVYYVSPANSIGFMDGGIDYALSRIIFPGIEKRVMRYIRYNGKINLLGIKYLPIGSSIIFNDEENPNKKLIVAPTMLKPHDVSKTNNCYYATMAVLYNILMNNKETDCEIILTSMCCGYGNMKIEDSINQLNRGIKEYKNFEPITVNENYIFSEKNLEEQPNFYENTAYKNIDPKDIIKQPKKITEKNEDEVDEIRTIIINK